jgi:sugar phosphate permease
VLFRSADLQADFAIGPAQLGNLAATYFYVYTLMQVPTGVLADTLGPRRIVALGGLIAGLGSLLFGLADSFALVSAGRLLIGLGVSTAFIALLKVNAAWFPENRFGSMAGLTLLIGNLGAVLAATPLAWALSWASWHDVFVGIGVISLINAALVWWLVRDRPEDVGLPSMHALAGSGHASRHDAHWLQGLREVAGNRHTWPGLFVNLGICGSYFAFAGLWAVPFLTRGHGMSLDDATTHTSLMLAAFALGAWLIGSLSDRLGRRRAVILATAAAYVLCWLPLVFLSTLPAGFSHLLFILLGLSASSFTLTWAAAKEINRPALSGMATSVVNVGGFLGAAILQPLVGWAIGQAQPGPGQYSTGIGLLLVAAIMGWLAALKIKETNCRNQFGK